MSSVPKILHIFSTFDLGGTEARTIRLISALNNDYSHIIWAGAQEAMSAKASMGHLSNVTFPTEAAALVLGRPGLLRYYKLAKAMRGYQLILTYSWGAADAVMAYRLFAKLLGLAPLIHHEDGFDEDAPTFRNRLKTQFRKYALPAAHALVVPSMQLEDIALQRWGVPANQLMRISNGINVDAFANITPAKSDICVVGTLAGLREVKNLPRLVRAVATAGPNVRLAIVGDGPERANIIAEAKRLNMVDRLDLHGFQSDIAHFLAGFDIFALSSDSEQYPIALAEAMAAGLPIVSTDVGDIRHMVTPANRAFIIPCDDEAGYGKALQHLTSNAAIRRQLGQANRDHAVRQFQESDMIAAYHKLYADAMAVAER
jgi:L-malate glycosyltransferase